MKLAFRNILDESDDRITEHDETQTNERPLDTVLCFARSTIILGHDIGDTRVDERNSDNRTDEKCRSQERILDECRDFCIWLVFPDPDRLVDIKRTLTIRQILCTISTVDTKRACE